MPYTYKGNAYKHIPRTSTVASSSTWFPSVRSLDCSDEALVNAFIMSGLFFPPNARFALLCHIVTLPYSARRRQPRPVSCKNSS